MSIFSFGKKKQEQPACACHEGCPVQENLSGVKGGEIITEVKVLGVGCKACHELYENVQRALQQMELSVAAEYVTDMEKIMEYGAMSMPALVVNGKVITSGKVLKPAEIEKTLKGDA